MQNIGSFNTRSVVPVPSDVLVDVWLLDDGECALEINVHPDDVMEMGTCVMLKGADLKALTEALAVLNDPARHEPSGAHVLPFARDFNDVIRSAADTGRVSARGDR
jgi:hypothetical protein